eukprot:COSAG02_NODE_7_length_64539_cov_120.393482_3_plen_123_part_00
MLVLTSDTAGAGRTPALLVLTPRALAALSAMSWHTRLSGSSRTQKMVTVGSGKAGCSGFMPYILGSTCPPGTAMQFISRIGGSVKLVTPSRLATQSRSNRQIIGAFELAGRVDPTIRHPFTS